MKTTKTFLPFIIAGILLLSVSASPLDVPSLSARINDNAGILSSQERDTLERILMDTETKTSSQVALLTIPSLEDEVLESYSIKVVEKWKLGQEKFDNGVLLLIALREKKIRLEIGYGLEPIITDAKSSYIIRNLIASEFKKGDYYAGIKNGLEAVTGLITKEFEISPEELAKFQKDQKKAKGSHFPTGIIIFFVLVAVSAAKNKGRGGRGGSSGVFWGGMGGSSFSSGGGSSSFGGFSGGGGSFGGGGSSGSW